MKSLPAALVFSSLLLLPLAASSARAATFAVTKTTDDPVNPEEGSLRWAILQSNATDSDADHPNAIVFNIGPAGVYPTQPFTIEPYLPTTVACNASVRTSALPQITHSVVIDGFTQNAWSGVRDGVHLIEISGKNADTDPTHPIGTPLGAPSTTCIQGIFINSGAHGSVLRGLVIDRWGRNGVLIQGSIGVKVLGNIIGFGFDGGWTMSPHGNGRNGIVVGNTGFNTAGTIIGGPGPFDGNVISASGTATYPSTCFTGGCPNLLALPNQGNPSVGIDVEGTSPGTIVQRNFIGTDADGNIGPQSPGNGYIGMFFGTAGNQVLGNVVFGSGMIQVPASALRLYTSPTPAPTAANPNPRPGLWATDNLVEGNAFYGNVGFGVNIAPGSVYNTVRGNYIAALPPGVAPWPGLQLFNNFAGIGVLASHNLVEGNVITRNGKPGVRSSGILVQVQGYTPPSYPYDPVVGNTIRSNSITGNIGLGIDISRTLPPPAPVITSPTVPAADGPNFTIPYDPANHSRNHLQNPPVLQLGNNPGHVSATFTSAPNTTFRLQVFSGPEPIQTRIPDPTSSTGYQDFSAPQAATLVREATVATNAAGQASVAIQIPTAAVPLGRYLTATATHLNPQDVHVEWDDYVDPSQDHSGFKGETSELSEALDLSPNQHANPSAYEHVTVQPFAISDGDLSQCLPDLVGGDDGP